MTPKIRKIALTAHIASSVGWFGAVAGFEALAIAGLLSSDAFTMRAAYLAHWLVRAPRILGNESYSHCCPAC